jgi:DNA polymerase-1
MDTRMKILVVDGTNVVMRYAHAMLADPKAEPSPANRSAVHESVERAIRECAEVAGCGGAIVAFDSPEETWRKTVYPAYKAHREPGATQDWSRRLREYLEPRGWLCAAAPTFEGDDVIATIVRRISDGCSHRAAVFSSDSDLLQLANSWVDVWQFGKRDAGERYVVRDSAWICRKYGIARPSQLRMWKALVGDPGDNLPGMPKIGPVKAKKLIDRFVTQSQILDHFATEGTMEDFGLMLELVSLREDVPLPTIIPSWCKIPTAGLLPECYRHDLWEVFNDKGKADWVR